MIGALLFAAHIFSGCGVQFSYPATWYARENPSDIHDAQMLHPAAIICSIGLRPPGWVDRNDRSFVDNGNWPVTIVFIRAPFLEAAGKGGFVRTNDLLKTWGSLPSTVKPGGWGIYARESVNPATRFDTECCRVVRGKSWAHENGRNGQVISTTSEHAVISRGGRSAIIDACDDTEFSGVLTRIIESFRFSAH